MTLTSLVLAISFLPFFEAKNTAVNYLLHPPPEGTAINCERPSYTTLSVCPACEGKGEIMLQEEDFGQASGRLGVAQKKRVKCAICKGRKRLETYFNPNDLLQAVSRDREKFISDHQGRGEIPVGQAFISAEDYAKFKQDRQQLKLIEEAYGKPCSCHWTGIETCRKCDGRGLLPCPNSDCKRGWAVTKTTTSYTRSKSGGNSLNLSNARSGFRSSSGTHRVSRKEERVNVHVCPTCEGASFILCAECQGRRAKPCRKCNGLGIKQKGFGL